MRKYVFATHGNFAEGIKNSVQMILGERDDIYCICAYVDELQSTMQQMENIIKSIDEKDEIIVITDLFGGSVNNEIFPMIKDSRIHLITGLNLMLATQLLVGNPEMDTSELIMQAVQASKDSIIYCNNIKAKVEEDNF